MTKLALLLAVGAAACGQPPPVTSEAGTDGSAMPDRVSPPDSSMVPDVTRPEAGAPEAGAPDVVDTDVVDTDAMDTDVVGPDAAMEAAVMCTAPQTLCSGACVDTQADSMNCGACGTACPAGNSCRMGACTPDCVAPSVVCGAAATCVNPQTDTTNCGACGNVCGMGQSCTAGACVCPAGATACGMGAAAVCVDVNTNAANCGTCGNACAAGQTCMMGSCRAPCVAPRMMCGATCTDTQTDSTNCGACGTSCPAGQSCSAGACVCPMGQTRCGAGAAATCTTTATDPANCGACGTVCGMGATCTAGACACPAGQSICGVGAAARCVNLQTDASACGMCSTTCAAGQNCLTGICTTGCSAPNTLCGIGASATCTNHQSDNANCGACGNNCGANGPCTTGQCRPLNNTPGTPIPLMVTLNGVRVTAVGNNQNGATAAAGQCAQRAVYYSVTFAQPAILYVDTFGSTVNTVAGIRPTGAAATTACVDDACAGTASQTRLVVPAGTHLIEVSGAAGATGVFTLNVAALPAAGGRNEAITPDSTARVLRGATLAPNATTNRVQFSCAGGGNGGDDAFYFTTCPSSAAARLHANNCASQFDAALEVRSAGGTAAIAVTCDDDGANAAACPNGNNSNLFHPVPAGAGLHVAYVDGFAANFGTYSFNYSLTCGSTYVACGASCRSVNTFETDNANCGACGRACPAGMACAAGVCGAATAPALLFAVRDGATANTAVAPAAAITNLDGCPDGSALVGIRTQNTTGGTTNQLANIAGLCAPVSVAGTQGVGAQRMVFGTTRTALPTRGGTTMLTAATDTLCPNNHVVVGYTVRTGAQVDAISLRCAPVLLSATAPFTTTVGTAITVGAAGGFGGSGDVTNQCAAGLIGVGIASRPSAFVESVAVICQRYRALQVAVNTAAIANQALVGGGGGGAFNDVCPAGNVLVGVEGDNTVSMGLMGLGQLRGVCRPIVGLRGTGPWTLVEGADALMTNRGSPGVPGTLARAVCAANNTMTNAIIDQRTSTAVLVSRIQPRCAAIGSTAAPAITITATGETPSVGNAGTSNNRACPAGTVGVSVIGRSGLAIDAFSFGCAPISIR
ncbi:MAG: hypothetical protein Q8Q09_25465 [Deltaproteobacteria bacterium]|nr:hypothetical protein [Deltaproteobacteria bacterium]